MVRLVKDKLEILSCFTAFKRASSSHDNTQSLFILLEDNLTVLPWPDTTHHVLLAIVLHAELLLDSEKSLGSTVKNCMSHRDSQGIRQIPTVQYIRISIN